MILKTVAATAAALLVGTVAAQAETYTVREAQSRYIACYERVYVPATIEVNTRGELVREGGEAWQTSGNHWNRVRELPVYIQSRTVIEPDHYTLVRKSCPH
ncbi:hypothetical protein [Salinarimonas ramus]|uniref:Uncharacterized protein n=1 Tax=Salinarimonas ramus TaxID=690164 RepID=A0A917V3M0_9HYPH|nr:hypothetical protein [Salinarimonas ramus]GGK35049.1 hypothetical protein GCM10011322_22290 [Salinarimonas ramus]